VITIVGILFAAGVVAYGAITVRSRNARRQADLEAIRQSLEMCRSLTGTYIDDTVGIYDSIVCGGNTLMSSTPKDPRDGSTGCQDGSYLYDVTNVANTTYTLTATCTEPAGADSYVVTNP
jgi:type II secretory pathway pseudopilin PulG